MEIASRIAAALTSGLASGTILHKKMGKVYDFIKAEMEKRADAADAPVLFFSLAVLICLLYTRKLAKIKSCAICTVR